MALTTALADERLFDPLDLPRGERRQTPRGEGSEREYLSTMLEEAMRCARVQMTTGEGVFYLNGSLIGRLKRSARDTLTSIKVDLTRLYNRDQSLVPQELRYLL